MKPDKHQLNTADKMMNKWLLFLALFLHHQDIIQGGILEITMGSEPSSGF